MAMTKAELATIIYEKCGFTRPESMVIVNQVFQILKETLEKGEKVKISGFGNFITHEKRPRKGRNPKTGEGIIISGRKVLKFKPSAMLRKVVNQGSQSSEKIEIQE